MRTRRTGLLVVSLTLGLLTAGAVSAGQSPADYQALRKEMDLLRERLAALQKEVDALKAQRPVTAAPAAAPAPPSNDFVMDLSKAPIRGSESARVTLVEVSDFECPFCGRYFVQTAPQIVRQYVDAGKIRQAYVHLPGAAHRYAFKAAEASVCAADQGKFWEMHDRLFSNQGPALAPELLPGKGPLAGLPNQDLYKSCLDSSKHAADVRADMAMVQQRGVTATPTFFLGTLDPKTRQMKVSRRIVGAKPFATFQQSLDELLAAESGSRGK
ncbi:MAG: thioredoxin domain-containing protein [Acidobacteriia bacterium]|nr:thioredoxin domain-containing protein [Terriglobia bacterium]